MKERLAQTMEERKYFLRVYNPETPFMARVEEEVAYSRDTGDLVLSIPEVPRCAFTFVKRANRVIANVTGPTHQEDERKLRGP